MVFIFLCTFISLLLLLLLLLLLFDFAHEYLLNKLIIIIQVKKI